MPRALERQPVQLKNLQSFQKLAALLIAALAFVLYVSSFRFEFVYDDVMQIVNNPLILSWHNLPWLFRTDVWRFLNPLMVGNYWRPLFTVWLLFNHSLFGFNPVGWHITSALLHALATYFCFRFVRRLSNDTLISTVAALVFAVHPCHVETVAWVSGATDSLMALFYITSLLAFVHGWEIRTASRTVWFVLSAMLFGFSLLSKETAVTLPLLVLAYVLLFGNCADRWRRVITPLLLYGLIFVLYWVGRNNALGGVSHSRVHVGVAPLLMTYPSLFLFYAKHLVWPLGLSVFYGTGIVMSATWSGFWLPLIATVLILGLATALVIRNRSKLLAFALLLLLVPLAPAFLVPAILSADFAHDRYLYLPSLGFAILIGVALSEVANRFRWKLLPAVVTGVLVLLLGVTSQSQMVFWANNVLLFDRATRIAPGFLPGYNSLSEALATRGRMSEAIFIMQQVVKADPQNVPALFNLGLGNFLNGNYEQAEQYLWRAASLNAWDGDTFALLAESRVRLGKYTEAESAIRRAIQVKPYKPGYRRVLALSLEGQGRFNEAVAAALEETAKNPGDVQTQQLLTKLKEEDRAKSQPDKKAPSR